MHRIGHIPQERLVVQLAVRPHRTLALMHGDGEPLATGFTESVVPVQNPARVATMAHAPGHSKYGLATPR